MRLDTAWMMIYGLLTNIQAHKRVFSIAKGLIERIKL